MGCKIQGNDASHIDKLPMRPIVCRCSGEARNQIQRTENEHNMGPLTSPAFDHKLSNSIGPLQDK